MALALSPEALEHVRHIADDPAIAQHLGRRVLINMIGPSAVGKSTLMEEALRADEDFGRVTSFTTRPRRAGEPAETYRFLPHSQATFDTVEKKLAKGSMVQLAIHPTTGHLYGSETSDYAAPYTMLDVLSGSVDSMRKLPFGHIVTLGVATYPESWSDWFLQRYAESGDTQDALKRLEEAESSLRWSLHDTGTLWVVNEPSVASVGAKRVTAAGRGEAGSSKDGRILAVRMQNTIPKIREQIQRIAI